MQFLIDEDLVCLNGRNPETAVEYTYQSTSAGREHYASVIDIIAISRGMYRREYRASVCPDTIALAQDHYAVLTDLRLNRSKIKMSFSKKPFMREPLRQNRRRSTRDFVRRSAVDDGAQHFESGRQPARFAASSIQSFWIP